jgi:hypothetical protein
MIFIQLLLFLDHFPQHGAISFDRNSRLLADAEIDNAPTRVSETATSSNLKRSHGMTVTKKENLRRQSPRQPGAAAKNSAGGDGAFQGKAMTHTKRAENATTWNFPSEWLDSVSTLPDDSPLDHVVSSGFVALHTGGCLSGTDAPGDSKNNFTPFPSGGGSNKNASAGSRINSTSYNEASCSISISVLTIETASCINYIFPCIFFITSSCIVQPPARLIYLEPPTG